MVAIIGATKNSHPNGAERVSSGCPVRGHGGTEVNARVRKSTRAARILRRKLPESGRSTGVYYRTRIPIVILNSVSLTTCGCLAHCKQVSTRNAETSFNSRAQQVRTWQAGHRQRPAMAPIVITFGVAQPQYSRPLPAYSRPWSFLCSTS